MSSLSIQRMSLSSTLAYLCGGAGRKYVSSQPTGFTIDHDELIPSLPVLLYLHRNFFAKALIDESDNPLRSGFAHSFFAAYSTSISYLKSARKAYAHCPSLVDRQWNFWAHCLIAAVRWSPTFVTFALLIIIFIGYDWLCRVQDKPFSGSTHYSRTEWATYFCRNSTKSFWPSSRGCRFGGFFPCDSAKYLIMNIVIITAYSVAIEEQSIFTPGAAPWNYGLRWLDQSS